MRHGRVARQWIAEYGNAWDRFWFQPRLPYTVCALRIIAGAMLLYSHLVLATDLTSFVGASAWVNNETAQQLHDGTFGFFDWGRSYLWHIENPLLLWIHHGITILVTAAFAIGCMTRFTGPMAWFLQLMYLHRLTGALFGFDQIVTYTVMYLMLSPCGSCFSVDAWLRRRMGKRRENSRFLCWLLPDETPSVAANIATRLMQLHLCVIYLFGGLAKARGQTWWDGTAMWYSLGNYEYQSVDMTWMVQYPRVFTAMTHVTLFWEVFYCALIWPPRTRPLMLAGAVMMHGGIAMFLGMITFGTMMIAANLIFVPPEVVHRVIRRRRVHPEEFGREEFEHEQFEHDEFEQKEFEHDEFEHEEFEHEEFEHEEFEHEEFEPEASEVEASEHQQSPVAGEELDGRWSELERREERLRLASKRLRAKLSKLKSREETYQDRVKRLKEREAKIKRLIERRREAKFRDEDPTEPRKFPPR